LNIKFVIIFYSIHYNIIYIIFLFYNDKEVINDLINNNGTFLKIITNTIKDECDLKKIIKMNNKWNKDYKNQDYIFMSRLDI